MKIAAVSAFSLLLAASPMPAATPSTTIASDPKVAAKLRAAEAWLATRLATDAIPGASVAIIHDQQLVWSHGFGFANLEKKVPATPQTRYSICSISKLFTSIAAMRERDAGRLDIDKPIGTYLDWYNIHDVAAPDGPVTPRAIMSHVAGLPREADMPYWTDAKFPDLATVKTLLGTQTNLYRAYDNLQYSNLGMTLLGEAVASTSGETYRDYIRTHLLTPLGLDSTTSELPRDLYGRGFAVGYKARRTGFTRQPFPYYPVNGLAPAAGFASTVEDLGKFASWQFRLLAAGGEDIVKSSTLREMQRVHWMTPDKPDETWGLGFITWVRNGKSFVGHGGYCPGYRASLTMRPQDKLAYVVMINVNDVDPGDISDELYDLTAADIIAAAGPPPTVPPPPAPSVDLNAYEGTWVTKDYDHDLYVIPHGNDLIGVRLFDPTPSKQPLKLRHVKDDIFQRVREDDTLAEPVRFERDAAGRPYRLWQNSNYWVRGK